MRLISMLNEILSLWDSIINIIDDNFSFTAIKIYQKELHVTYIRI